MGSDEVNLNGLRIERRNGTILVELPRSAWREIPFGCSCAHCAAARKADPDAKSYWDTLAIAADPKAVGPDTTWTVHAPRS